MGRPIATDMVIGWVSASATTMELTRALAHNSMEYLDTVGIDVDSHEHIEMWMAKC